MGDMLSRLERDRALFETDVRQQLRDTISHSDPRLVAGAITRVIELQIVTEEIARERGFEVDENTIADFTGRNREYLNQQVERALTAFIGLIVSQEG